MLNYGSWEEVEYPGISLYGCIVGYEKCAHPDPEIPSLGCLPVILILKLVPSHGALWQKAHMRKLLPFLLSLQSCLFASFLSSVCFPFIRSYFLLINNSQLFPALSIRTNKMASTGLKEDTDDEEGALALEKPTVESGRQTWKQRISQPDEDHNYVSNIINMIKKTEQIIFLGGIRTVLQRSWYLWHVWEVILLECGRE